MTVQEAKIKKKELEEKIYSLIKKFQDETYLEVKDISLLEFRSMGTVRPTLVGVVVDVKL